MSTNDMDVQVNLDELDALLHALYEETKPLWPDLSLGSNAFCAQAKKVLLASDDEASLFERAEKLHALDFFLATACLEGCSQATKHIVGVVLPKLALGRVTETLDDAQEVRQIVADKLLVARPDSPAKLSEYSGRGPLASWLQVVAMRTAIDLLRRRGKTQELDTGSLARMGATDEVELEYLKGRYKAEFRQALEDAFGTLEKRERSILKLNLVDQLNIAEIGQLYGVHRATVARWIAEARTQLFSETRQGLDRALGGALSPSEFGNVVDLVLSQMDLSIQRLLQTKTSTPR